MPLRCLGAVGMGAQGAWADGQPATCIRVYPSAAYQLSGAANFIFTVDYEGKAEESENFFSLSGN